MSAPRTSRPHVTVVGAGMAGAACAVALQCAGVPVRVLERGRAPGGRLASPELHGRRVDIGAGYFTVRDPEFARVVDRWRDLGLARPWTDTFGVLTRGKPPSTTSGPMRWATPGGLRSLVRDLLEGIDVQTGDTVDQLPSGDVVLAMPDPQAARLLPVQLPGALAYDPVIAVVCGFADRAWPFADAAFVHDHPDLDFVADDGARRGDGVAVLVAHCSPALARAHLDEPGAATAPVVAALREMVGCGEPLWTHPHRWTFAKPVGQHDSTFRLSMDEHGTRIGLAGDQWCPSGSPRVESAWRSGTDLGRALAGLAPVGLAPAVTPRVPEPGS